MSSILHTIHLSSVHFENAIVSRVVGFLILSQGQPFTTPFHFLRLHGLYLCITRGNDTIQRITTWRWSKAIALWQALQTVIRTNRVGNIVLVQWNRQDTVHAPLTVHPHPTTFAIRFDQTTICAVATHFTDFSLRFVADTTTTTRLDAIIAPLLGNGHTIGRAHTKAIGLIDTATNEAVHVKVKSLMNADNGVTHASTVVPVIYGIFIPLLEIVIIVGCHFGSFVSFFANGCCLFDGLEKWEQRSHTKHKTFLF